MYTHTHTHTHTHIGAVARGSAVGQARKDAQALASRRECFGHAYASAALPAGVHSASCTCGRCGRGCCNPQQSRSCERASAEAAK